MKSLIVARALEGRGPVGRIWCVIRSLAGRVRMIQTPWVGFALDPPTPGAHGRVAAGVAGEREVDGGDFFEPQSVHEEILCAVAASREGALSARQVSNRLGLSALRAEYHLDELEDEGFLESDGSVYYGLSGVGTAYLVEADLVD